VGSAKSRGESLRTDESQERLSGGADAYPGTQWLRGKELGRGTLVEEITHAKSLGHELLSWLRRNYMKFRGWKVAGDKTKEVGPSQVMEKHVTDIT
jgi:hypothetical protein